MSVICRFKYVMLVGIMFLVSCENAYYVFLKKEIADQFELHPYTKIVFIPGVGCNGCIGAAEKYFRKNASDTTCLYIFTNYISYKGLGLRLGGEQNISKKNVYVDSTGIFLPSNVECSIYPLKMKVDNGKIELIETF